MCVYSIFKLLPRKVVPARRRSPHVFSQMMKPILTNSKQIYILKNLLVTRITCKRQMVHTMNRTHCSHFLNSFDRYLQKMNSGFQIDSSIEFGLRGSDE